MLDGHDGPPVGPPAKDYMLTYKKSDQLEVTGYSDSDFAGCLDDRKSTFGFIFMMAGGVVKDPDPD